MPPPQAVYKKLLGMPVGLSDLEEMSPSVGKSLRALLEYSGPGTVQDVFCLTFAAEVHRFGEVEEVELKPGGSRIDVVSRRRRLHLIVGLSSRREHRLRWRTRAHARPWCLAIVSTSCDRRRRTTAPSTWSSTSTTC